MRFWCGTTLEFYLVFSNQLSKIYHSSVWVRDFVGSRFTGWHRKSYRQSVIGDGSLASNPDAHWSLNLAYVSYVYRIMFGMNTGNESASISSTLFLNGCVDFPSSILQKIIQLPEQFPLVFEKRVSSGLRFSIDFPIFKHRKSAMVHDTCLVRNRCITFVSLKRFAPLMNYDCLGFLSLRICQGVLSNWIHL